jgi:membrane fusion protein (multidrug efflux system)
VAALIVLFAVFKKPPEKLPAPPEKAVPVRVAKVVPRVLPDTLRLPGRVEAGVDVLVSTETAGRVAEVAADRGARVAAGQPVVRLDVSTWKAQFRRMEIEFHEAEKELARWQALEKAGSVSASDLDKVRKVRDQASAGMDEARVHVERGEVRSPVAGIVDDRYLEAGEYAREGDKAFRVVDAGTVKVVVQVPEREAGRVRAGGTVPFTAAALPGAVFTGTVAHVAVAGGRENNSFRTEIRAPNPGGALRPGMIAEAAFDRGTRENAIVAPMTAVIPKRGEYYVFVAKGNRAAIRYVRLAALVGQEAVVESGLSAGDLLLVEGHRGVQDGTLLQLTEHAD